MRKTLLLMTLCLTVVNIQMAQADVVSTYDVEVDFDDGTFFAGNTTSAGTAPAILTYDNTTKTVTGLSGYLYDSMGDTVQLDYLLPSPSHQFDGSGNVMASVYALNFVTPYTESIDSGQNNAFVTVDFNPSNPTAVTQDNINQTVFMDCTANSGMAPQCSTGINGTGTMANPQSETITFVSSTGTASAVPLPSAVWSFLAGTLGLLSFSKKRKTL